MSCRFPPYTEKSKSIITKLMKVGTITNGQVQGAVIGLVLLIVVGLVVGLVVVPRVKGEWMRMGSGSEGEGESEWFGWVYLSLCEFIYLLCYL